MDTITKNEKFTFFWGGTFSQWCPSTFTVDGIEFCTCEQYMMYKKALMFHDYEVASDIMKTTSPKEQKALGRKVKNFNKFRWEEYCREIVYDANVAKFTQNDDMRAELMATEGTSLVEASPKDVIWGIGLSEKDPLAQNRDTWKGKNWLGEAIEQVREDIKDGIIKI